MLKWFSELQIESLPSPEKKYESDSQNQILIVMEDKHINKQSVITEWSEKLLIRLSSIPKLLLQKMVIIRRGLVIFSSPPLSSRNLSEARTFPHKNHWPGWAGRHSSPWPGPPHHAALNIQNGASGGAWELGRAETSHNLHATANQWENGANRQRRGNKTLGQTGDD